jgi:hypothetical protein
LRLYGIAVVDNGSIRNFRWRLRLTEFRIIILSLKLRRQRIPSEQGQQA